MSIVNLADGEQYPYKNAIYQGPGVLRFDENGALLSANVFSKIMIRKRVPSTNSVKIVKSSKGMDDK